MWVWLCALGTLPCLALPCLGRAGAPRALPCLASAVQGHHALEVDSAADDVDALPRTQPRFSSMSLLGAGNHSAHARLVRLRCLAFVDATAQASERDEARAGAASAVLAGPPPPAATAKAKPRVGTELV